ncbi:hypothetical protein MMC21_002905 [Puttea exsequens]|nr:hypothetical protein [Puttea exsequens]
MSSNSMQNQAIPQIDLSNIPAPEARLHSDEVGDEHYQSGRCPVCMQQTNDIPAIEAPQRIQCKRFGVVFDDDNAHRRKSSLVDADHLSPSIKQRSEQSDNTACFVHHLLERERKTRNAKGSNLQEINEDTLGDKRDGPDHGPATHSRLLTKKQLSEMAWGVRELSKRLGSVRLKLKVKNVFLLTKAHDESLIGYTKEVVDWLLSKDRQVPYTVYVENTLAQNKTFDAQGIVSKDPSREGRLKYWNNELCAKHPLTFDFIVTLGGDGTLLYASWLFQRIVPPVLSFALGSLGFLTKFDYSSFRETLSTAFADGVTVSLRLRFEGTVMRSQNKGAHRDLIEELIGAESDNDYTHKADRSYEILNDIVVDRGPNPTMSAIEIFGDDEHFTTVQADGVCVATPTGSTAYNLAAGGSLCHPENPVILVTAICAHTLSFRPIILPDTIVLRVGVPYDARTSSWASFDGRERVELCPGDYVTISASRYPFANVMQQGRRSEDWVNSISRTLNWNSRQRQKSFKEWQTDEQQKVP